LYQATAAASQQRRRQRSRIMPREIITLQIGQCKFAFALFACFALFNDIMYVVV